MANPEHLEMLNKGVELWNEWRRENHNLFIDLREADLRGSEFPKINFNGADLTSANLEYVDLNNAWLNEAKLIDTTLRAANLQQAILESADLFGADLIGVDFRHAHLVGANFQQANLSEAFLNTADLYSTQFHLTKFDRTVFKNASMMKTIFADCDLSTAIGLDEVIHEGPSEIGISTVYKSKGELSHKFLRDAGIPENFITYMSSLTGKAFEYFSAFISYTEADDTFSKRLYEGLQTAGLRVWRWREDAKWGAPIEKNIDQAVRIYDKLIVICSKDSLKAPAVIDEIDRAFQKEHALMKDGKVPEVLFPITIDDYIFDEWEHYLKPKVMAKTVGDFRGWEDPKKYDVALQRLITGLGQEDSNGE